MMEHYFMNGIKHQVLSDSYDSDGIKSMLISVQSYNSNDNSNVKTNFDNSNNVISFGLFILNATSIAIVAAAVSRVVRGKNKLTKK